jgi:amidophosphoribosyltransferase
MAREMGAKKVYFASAAPAVRFPNVYGIDMPSVDELVAYGRTDAEVGEVIGADRMIYQDLADLVRSTQGGGSDIANFDCSVFDGNYVTGDVDDAYLANLEAARNDQSMHNVNVIDDDVSLATNMQSKL